MWSFHFLPGMIKDHKSVDHKYI